MAPNTVGPPSVRTRAWPRSRSQATASPRSRSSPSATTVEAAGSLAPSTAFPHFVVRTSAPFSNTGWSTSIEPLRVRIATSGSGGSSNRSRSSSSASRVGGCGPPGAHSPCGEPCSVPDPTTMTSANARSKPIRNRSASLPRRDDLVRVCDRRDRDHTVERRDEVRVQPRSREPERAAVQPGELVGEVEGRQPLVFEEEVEHYGLWAPLRARSRNSRRRSAFSSYVPRQKVVTVRECSSRTPRICVHRCSASR